MPRWLQITFSLVLFAAQMGSGIAATVTEFATFPVGQQRSYLIGIRDGLLGIALTTDDNAWRSAVRDCTAGLKTDADLLVAFSAWLRVHPEVYPQPVPAAFVRWAYDICPSAKAAR